jgi:hypothetical protein
MSTTSKLLFITAIPATLPIALNIQEQVIEAFNDNNNRGLSKGHSHVEFPRGTCLGNEGTVVNGPNVNSN